MKIKHIVFVEDDDLKYRAIARFLKWGSVSMVRVCTYKELCDHMLEHGRNVQFILSDWSFPFSERNGVADACAGEHVVKMANGLGIPYAVISGSDRPLDFEGAWATTTDHAAVKRVLGLVRAAAA